MLFAELAVNAQDKITGHVADLRDSSSLPGVTVNVRGTNTSVQTDAAGNFSIAAPGNAVLRLSFVGFEPIDVPVNNRNNITVNMSQAVSRLNEVVVVAYGSRRRGDLRGAVTSVSEKDFQKGFISSSEQLLQGKVPGLQITSGGGSAGGGSRIRIRGGASPQRKQRSVDRYCVVWLQGF